MVTLYVYVVLLRGVLWCFVDVRDSDCDTGTMDDMADETVVGVMGCLGEGADGAGRRERASGGVTGGEGRRPRRRRRRRRRQRRHTWSSALGSPRRVPRMHALRSCLSMSCCSPSANLTEVGNTRQFISHFLSAVGGTRARPQPTRTAAVGPSHAILPGGHRPSDVRCGTWAGAGGRAACCGGGGGGACARAGALRHGEARGGAHSICSLVKLQTSSNTNDVMAASRRPPPPGAARQPPFAPALLFVFLQRGRAGVRQCEVHRDLALCLAQKCRVRG